MTKRTNKKVITEIGTPSYNKRALQQFNIIMNEIKAVDMELQKLNDVALVCSEQGMQAILTLTVLDKKKYDDLNEQAEKDLRVKGLTEPGDIIFIPSIHPGQQFNSPPQKSREETQKEKLIEVHRRNAHVSTFQVHTENYPSISLVILDKLKIALQEKRDELNKEANEIYRAVFMPQEH